MSIFTDHAKGFAPLKDYQTSKVARTIMLTKREAQRRHKLCRPILTTVYSILMVAGIEKTQQVLVMSPFKMISCKSKVQEPLGQDFERVYNDNKDALYHD